MKPNKTDKVLDKGNSLMEVLKKISEKAKAEAEKKEAEYKIKFSK